MSHTLFHMWGRYREQIIKNHNFYVEQAKVRLLSQFDEIEKEADEHGERWLESTNHLFDPERHDPGDFYEQAYEESISHYQMLDDMRNRTRLSVVAGMFHEWDKQLRGWVSKEISHWNRGDELKNRIWAVNFNDLIDLFEDLGWSIKSRGYYSILNKYRLVVNAYKHGNGAALNEIKASYPEFFVGLSGDDFGCLEYMDYADLIIEDKHIHEFSEAVIDFWKGVPEYIQNKSEYENLPKWFEKAYSKDTDIKEAEEPKEKK